MKDRGKHLTVILSGAKNLSHSESWWPGGRFFASLRMTGMDKTAVFENAPSGLCKAILISTLLVALWGTCGGGALAGTNHTDDSPLVVRAAVDRSVITIGDKIRYTLTVTADPDVEFDLPPLGEEVAGFAILDHGVEDSRDRTGRRVASQWYLLDTYTVDTYVIVPASVTYRDESGQEHAVTAPPVTVRVESLLDKAGETDELHDVKPPVSVPGPKTVYYAAAAVVGVLALAGLAVWQIRRRRERKAEPPMPPWQIAYSQLAQLRSMELPAKGEIGLYYVHLSDIVRHYIENRFGLRAPEMTTEEFLAVVAGAAGLPQRHELLLTTFLSHCDMVKFARYGPTETEMLDAFDAAVRFVDETAYGLEPEPQPAEAAA